MVRDHKSRPKSQKKAVVQMSAPPPIAALTDDIVASSGTCHCYPEWHDLFV